MGAFRQGRDRLGVRLTLERRLAHKTPGGIIFFRLAVYATFLTSDHVSRLPDLKRSRFHPEPQFAVTNFGSLLSCLRNWEKYPLK